MHKLELYCIKTERIIEKFSWSAGKKYKKIYCSPLNDNKYQFSSLMTMIPNDELNEQERQMRKYNQEENEYNDMEEENYSIVFVVIERLIIE